MQNKANLLNVQMNVTIVLTEYYENFRLCSRGEKQTQSNPIYEESKMSLTPYMTKEYENISGLLTIEKRTQSNPIASQPPHFQNFLQKPLFFDFFIFFPPFFLRQFLLFFNQCLSVLQSCDFLSFVRDFEMRLP